MDYFEFVTDQYFSIKHRHYFEGFIFNRIPVVKKLNWRFLTTASMLMGGLSSENMKITAPVNNQGVPSINFSSLSHKPYIELGYGIENIFKIFRVDAFHRITYLDKPSARKFGVKFSVQFTL